MMGTNSNSTMATRVARTLITTCAVAGTLLAAGCQRQEREITEATGDLAAVVEGNNQFAVDLHGAAGQGNVFFSPFSINAALSMVYAGAEGETEQQIADVLGVTVDEETWHVSMGALFDDLVGQHHRGYTLHGANAFWGQENAPFHAAFVDTLENRYLAPLQLVDFEGQSGQATEDINGWVSDQTRGKIEDLFKPGDINAYTKFVLANAIYFKSDWIDTFDEDLTRERDFFVTLDETVSVPQMTQLEYFPYTVDEQVQVLEMPYEDDELAMLIVLPLQVDGLAAVEAELSARKLDLWIDDLVSQEVDVTMPTFEMRHELPLRDTLEALGLTDGFDQASADFSGIVDLEDMNGNYYLHAARHQAYVKVDEKGTEAAAATGFAGGDDDDAAYPEFIADHPFLYLIRDKLTGAILFMGRVEDPS